MLGSQDDITKFEYLKKTSQTTGTVIIGIQLKHHSDLIQLKERVNHFDPSISILMKIKCYIPYLFKLIIYALINVARK